MEMKCQIISVNNSQDSVLTLAPIVISCIKGERDKSHAIFIKEVMICNIYI